jgi:hypothetical protein
MKATAQLSQQANEQRAIVTHAETPTKYKRNFDSPAAGLLN